MTQDINSPTPPDPIDANVSNGANKDAGINERAALDPAARSLSDALTLSFKLLTFVMTILAVVFLFSGFYNVKENEVVVLTRFGKIVPNSVDNSDFRTAGGPYLAMPSPIDQVTRVPTTVQRVELMREFWFELRPGDDQKTNDELMGSSQRNLAPGRDGSLITGDKNIVHARFVVTYQVAARDAGIFVKNVGDMQRAALLVQTIAQEAVVKAVGTAAADDFVRSNFDAGRAAARLTIQRKLDDLKSGITVNEVVLTSPEAPMSVRQAFLDVNNAQSERAQRIDQARQEATRIQAEAAGPAYPALLVAIDEYERATREAKVTGNRTRADLIDGAISALLEGQPFQKATAAWLESEKDSTIKDQLAGIAADATAGGQVSRVINEARSYRTQLVQQVRGDVDRFNQLLKDYQSNPRLIEQRMWQDTFQTMLSGDVETFWFSPDQKKDVIIPFKRDPTVARARSEAAARAQAAGVTAGRPPTSSTPPSMAPTQTAPATR